MRRARLSRDPDYRAVLESTGDVSLGAYARAERRRRILIGIGGTTLIAGALGLYFAVRPRDSHPAAGTVPVVVQCVADDCGYSGVVRIRLGAAVFPVECPRCKRFSCQKVWECRDCGHSPLRTPHILLLTTLDLTASISGRVSPIVPACPLAP